jgi:predicted GNAT family acetyltransferase
MSVAPLTLASSQDVVQLPEADLTNQVDPDFLELATGPSSLSGPVIPELPANLATVSTRELRILSNQLYRVLDTDFPPFGVQEDYEAVVEALEERATRAVRQNETEADQLREKFRDNAVSSRFELFHDGAMVGYVKYDMRAGRVRLLETVVGPSYQHAGLEPVLVRQALLNIHRRRLAPVPYCRHAQAFLAENPQFQAMIPTS